MKLIFEKLMSGSEEGFIFKEIRSHCFSRNWHFHTESELTLTLHCPGYRMVGDDLAELEAGDLVLVGANLPHIWQRDEGKPRQRGPVHILIVQFEEDSLGRDFWKISATSAPRDHSIRQLLPITMKIVVTWVWRRIRRISGWSLHSLQLLPA